MEFFDFVKRYGSVYVASGIEWGVIKEPSECTGATKQLLKALVLGCGYGAGAATFQRVAKTYGIELTLDEARERVEFFREKSPKTVRFWYSLRDSFQGAEDRTLKQRLPSGRIIRYRDIHRVRVEGTDDEFEYKATTRLDRGTSKTGAPVFRDTVRRIWHGVLAENICSGAARDVFMHAVVRLHDLGHKILFTAHDEVISEAPEAEAEARLAETIRVLSEPPPWMPGIVLGAEGSIEDRYMK